MTKRKTCLITGANSGIGKQAAIQIATKGYRVLMGCRNRSRGKVALQEVRALSGSDAAQLVLVDLSSPESIRSMAREVEDRHEVLDVLIHNAGYFDITQKQRRLTDQGVELTWATNHLGPVLMTDLLLPALRRAEQGRILLVSSKGLVVYPNLRVNLEDVEFERCKFSVEKAYSRLSTFLSRGISIVNRSELPII
jgi:NAD(P)-dependent dehydrogenase (short-subunit alcohol dehydrogenase family)